jgi:signal transduction histidine kinase
VARTLAAHADDPIRETDLVLDGSEPRVHELVEAGFEPLGHRPLEEAPAAASGPETAANADVGAGPASGWEAEASAARRATAGEETPRPRAPVASQPRVRGSEAPASRPEASEAQIEGEAPRGEDPGVAHLRQLVGSIAHEIRNPLVAVRTFAQLLPERFDDPDFRRKAADIVGADVRRIENVVARLGRLAELDAPEPKAVDVASLIETALESARGTIQRRRLVVLTELDRTAPYALGDAEQLRFAFEALLDKALELVPDRGDLYFASKHHADGLDGGPALRVLIRFRSPGELAGRGDVPGVSLGENALEMTVARSIVAGHGGRMTVSPGDARETVVVIDLPAPA